jgi:peptidoglycan/LPS O-acetylase OafA/YrhL
MKTREKVRIELLDVIRGIAASLVVIHHVLRKIPGLDSERFWEDVSLRPWWTPLAFHGDLAVTIFFVLSGTSLAIACIGTEQSFLTFYRKRFFRIYPLFALVLLMNYATQSRVRAHVDANIWISYLTFAFNWTRCPRPFIGVLWSLATEMQFYLFFPVFMLALKRSGKSFGSMLVGVFCLVCFLVSSRFHLEYAEMLERLWEFGGGVIIGANLDIIRRIGDVLKIRISLMLLTIAMWFFAILSDGHAGAVLFSFCLTMLALYYGNWKSRSVFSKFLVHIGTVSYGLYLWHCIFIGKISHQLEKTSLSPILLGVILFVLIYSLSLVLSSISYRFYEKPFMSIGSSRKKSMSSDRVIQEMALRQ